MNAKTVANAARHGITVTDYTDDHGRKTVRFTKGDHSVNVVKSKAGGWLLNDHAKTGYAARDSFTKWLGAELRAIAILTD
jgi:hypothetical protein